MEKTAQDTELHRASRAWLPYVVLAIALALTGVCTLYVSNAAVTKQRLRFAAAVTQVQENIINRLEMYIATLRGGTGLFAAMRDVSPQQFRYYFQRLELNARYPGIQGIGFAEAVLPADVPRVEGEFRQIYPNFRIWPEGSRDIYFPIVVLEPDDELNRRAIGFDMFAEPTRHAAMERARDTAAAAASAKVRLVQEGESPASQAGFLIYLPVYRSAAAPDTIEQRRDGIMGFVYSPFRADDLLRGIFGRTQAPLVDVVMYDGPVADEQALLHRSAPDRGSYHPLHHTTEQLAVAGRPWTIQFMSNPNFDAEAGRPLTPFVLMIGIAVSLALFFMTRSQVRARSQAEQIAEDLGQSERALRASESRFRRLAESNMIGIVFARTDGTVIDANLAYCQIIGRSQQEVRQGKLRQQEMTAAESLEADARAAAEVQANGVCRPYEKQYIRPDGTLVPVLIGVAMLEGSTDQTVGFAIDLTERKSHERDLSAAKEAAERANRAKDQFLAVLSHELRTPLTPVLAVAAAGQADPALPAAVLADYAMIRRNVELEARLIDDLLDLTKIGRGKLQLHLETVDLHRTLRAALEVCSPDEIAAKRLQINIELNAGHHFVRGDPARLQQIFWNLLKNAIKFTPAGGSVTVRSRNIPPIGETPASVGGRRESLDDILIEVIDTGVGIDPAVLPRIFDAFEQGQNSTTREYGGLGLGLAISKGLMLAHRGTITASSQGRNSGATFTLTFPTVNPRHFRPAGPARSGGGEQRSLSILLVEDHPDTSRALQRLLSSSGHEVHTAGAVAEAAELGRELDFDLLISDLGLPDGTGIELLQRLRAELDGSRRFSAIALTGFGMDEDVARTRAAGFDEHLTKPIDFQKLQAAIQRLGAVASRAAPQEQPARPERA
jgi:PAS domain S-box-containing protein